MFLPDNLPSDSVLRRHALTEYHRMLGLPPTDSVLRRHFDSLPKTAFSPAAAAPATRGAAHPSARPAASAPAGGGGLMGWLRRLFGG